MRLADDAPIHQTVLYQVILFHRPIWPVSTNLVVGKSSSAVTTVPIIKLWL